MSPVAGVVIMDDFRKHMGSTQIPYHQGEEHDKNHKEDGDVKEPLQEGDVITIEPGIYIPEEKFGVRIEDNYWIVEGGAVCLSEM